MHSASPPTRSTPRATCRASNSWWSACKPAIERSPLSVLYFCPGVAYHSVMEVSQPASAVIGRLRAVGLRPTRQRLALLGLLFAKGDRHVTAEQLHSEVLVAAIPVSL